MVIVILEAFSNKGEKVGNSFGISTKLEPEFKKIEGFISLDRFSHMIEDGEGRVSFLSYWRDKNSIKAWQKREAQRLIEQGRSSFNSYQVIVTNVSEVPQ